MSRGLRPSASRGSARRRFSPRRLGHAEAGRLRRALRPREQVREVGQVLGDDVDDFAFPLHLAPASDHARREDEAALPFEQGRPDDQVRDLGLVFKRDEQHAVGRARPLPHEHEPGDRHAAAVPDLPRLDGRHEAARCKVSPQKRDGMRAQRQPAAAIVLDDFPAGRHRRERDAGFINFRPQHPRRCIRRGEQRQRLAGKRPHLPKRLPPAEPERAESIGLGQALQSRNRHARTAPQVFNRCEGCRARAATIKAPSRFAKPRAVRSPSRTAKRPPSAGSSVQSHRESLTSGGRTSTPCCSASRTSWAGA